MKIFVVHATAGGGHKSAAEAIYDRLNTHYADTETRIIDILDYTNPLFAANYSAGYSFVVTHLSFLWALSYHLTSIWPFSLIFNIFSRLNCRRFIKLLIEQQPDVIVATHFFSAEVTSLLKQKGKLNSRLITIMTDYSFHPLWHIANCDCYVVASKHNRNCLLARDVQQNRIRMLGIPTKEGFEKQAKSKNATSPELTALLVTGSFGFSSIEKVVKLLCRELKLLVVCGNNKALYDKLAQENYPEVRLFGFTKEMHKLMQESDLIITKPGGLTITESLVSWLPMVFFSSIPGQEAENAKILESQGCAINAKDTESLKKIIIDFKEHPQKLDLVRSNIQNIRKPQATEEICNLIMSETA